MAPPPAADDPVVAAFDLARDPVWQAALNAPPAPPDLLSSEEWADLEDGMEDVRAGRTVPHAEVQAEVDRAAAAMARFGAAAENADISLGEVLHWLDTGEASPGIAALLAGESAAAE